MNTTDTIHAAATNADNAQQALDRVDASAGMSGQGAAVEKFSQIANVRALVSIAHSLVILAAARTQDVLAALDDSSSIGFNHTEPPETDPDAPVAEETKE